MEKLPNGGLSIDHNELDAAIIAFDLSPAPLSGSSLAERLRLARKAYGDAGLVDYAKTHINYVAKLGTEGRLQEVDEFVTTAFDKFGVSSGRTVILSTDKDVLVDALLNLLDAPEEKLRKRVLKWTHPDLLSVPNIVEEVSQQLLADAQAVIDTLYPPEPEVS